MKTTLSDAKSILERAGFDVRSIEEPPSGYSGAKFYCNIDGRQVYVAVLNKKSFQVLLSLHKRLEKHNSVPLALVEDSGHDEKTNRYFVLQTPIVGENLHELANAEEFLRDAGALLRNIHSTKFFGFGALVVEADGEIRGKFDTWGEFIDGFFSPEKINYLFENGFLDQAQADFIRTMCKELAQTAPKIGSLLHNDYHKAHVFSDGKKITGVIDWGKPIVGAVEYDLAVTSIFLNSDFPILQEGYGRGFDLVAVEKYRLLVAVHKTFWSHSKAPARFEYYEDVLNTALKKVMSNDSSTGPQDRVQAPIDEKASP